MGYILSIKAKLIITFTLILITISGTAIFNYHQLQTIGNQIASQNQTMEKKLLAMQLKQYAQVMDNITSELIISRNLDLAEKYDQNKKVFLQHVEHISGEAETRDQRKWRSFLNAIAGEYANNFIKAEEIIKNEEINDEEKLARLQNLYSLSQAHKGRIFELADNFYNDFSNHANAAIEQSRQTLNRSSVISMVLAYVVLFISTIIAYVLFRSLNRPISKLKIAVQLISEGDLTHKINASSKDELGQLSKGFDLMIEKVNSMLRKTKNIASSLSDYSLSFENFSKTTAAANGDITKAIEEISKGADQQAVQSEHSSLLIAEMEQEVDSIQLLTHDMKSFSGVAADHAKKGSDTIDSLKQSSQESSGTIGKVYTSLKTLAESTAQIGIITNAITDISNQTNILSLNAAIEAARAGIHGKGFAVIAEEVRNLSLKTNESSKNISGIIQVLQTRMKEVLDNMLQAQKTIRTQNAKVENTRQAFQSIYESVEHITNQIDQIYQKVDQAQEKNKRLVDTIHCVAAIAEQTAAGVQEVNSTSLQQDASIKRIAEQAKEINVLSRQLFQEINKFKMNEQMDLGKKDSDPSQQKIVRKRLWLNRA